jgi:hypothetical protein
LDILNFFKTFFAATLKATTKLLKHISLNQRREKKKPCLIGLYEKKSSYSFIAAVAVVALLICCVCVAK